MIKKFGLPFFVKIFALIHFDVQDKKTLGNDQYYNYIDFPKKLLEIPFILGEKS